MTRHDDIDWEHAFDDFHPTLAAHLYESEDYRVGLAMRDVRLAILALVKQCSVAAEAVRSRVARRRAVR